MKIYFIIYLIYSLKNLVFLVKFIFNIIIRIIIVLFKCVRDKNLFLEILKDFWIRFDKLEEKLYLKTYCELIFIKLTEYE